MPHPLDALVTEQDRTRDLTGELETALWKLETLQENMAQLELSREDAGWQLLTSQGKQDMTREGIIRHAEQHRVMAIANPLVRRGLHLSAAYCFGQGVGTVAKGDAVNALVQDFLDDPVVRDVFAGAQANSRNQIALGTDGNLFFALPTDRLTGAVTIRDIPMDEIAEIITAPGDKATVQYYLRVWAERDPASGKYFNRKAAYPALRYSPVTKHKRIRLSASETAPVQWDVPVYHVAVNQLKGQQWGTADVFSAIPWARAYSDFLNDWAKLVKSLSKIAWMQTSKGKPGHSRQARAEAARMGDMPAGSTAVMSGETTLQAVPKTGATIDSESGRPLATMIAAGFGLPVTTLLSDPGQTGARATAETLNLPTRLVMEARQEVWRETRRQILEYVILQAMLAPRGVLRRRGRVNRTQDTLRPVFREAGEGTLTVDFPPLDDTPVEVLVKALVEADSVGLVPPLVILEKLLRAIGLRDVDEVIASVTDDQGNFVPPQTVVADAAGQRAADALRAGGNPADIL
ncbi:hypothetical protein [Nesterenkonia sandarakina]|uniref:SPP1 Gp6-like portal protein n=1 Tax=Nesterenkonia sandarakina TaxID=272918 RepID=A0A2T0YIX7_9MICC|nr:hypothetical protein [Nesterenkonia sandarakina]PRZ15155.1 hypothetical protein BCL67_10976 [Nesterenkonia sandarakina]